MKLLAIIFCLICALSLLVGCGPQKRDAAAQIPAEETVETAEFESEEIDEIIAEQIEESGGMPSEEEADAEKDENAAALAALLEDVRASVFPGTAGSSLSAAARAAAIADFFAESGMSPDEAEVCARDYIASLSDEDAQLFEMQLDAVVGAFSNLTGEHGEGLLSDCGYESAHFPWEDGSIRDCFAAMLGSD